MDICSYKAVALEAIDYNEACVSFYQELPEILEYEKTKFHQLKIHWEVA